MKADAVKARLARRGGTKLWGTERWGTKRWGTERWGTLRWGTERWQGKHLRPGMRPRIRIAGLAFSVILFSVILLVSSSACGYHTAGSSAGQSAVLPQNIHTIAIPAFGSQSRTFRVEQVLTDAVVREFNTRTQLRVLHNTKEDADAVLKGTVLSASTTPLAYDSTTGRAASALVTLSITITLTDRQGKIVFQNPSYLFHDQYEISRDLNSFFEEESPAIDRMSRDFARTLVANILEAY